MCNWNLQAKGNFNDGNPVAPKLAVRISPFLKATVQTVHSCNIRLWVSHRAPCVEMAQVMSSAIWWPMFQLWYSPIRKPASWTLPWIYFIYPQAAFGTICVANFWSPGITILTLLCWPLRLTKRKVLHPRSPGFRKAIIITINCWLPGPIESTSGWFSK